MSVIAPWRPGALMNDSRWADMVTLHADLWTRHAPAIVSTNLDGMFVGAGTTVKVLHWYSFGNVDRLKYTLTYIVTGTGTVRLACPGVANTASVAAGSVTSSTPTADSGAGFVEVIATTDCYVYGMGVTYDDPAALSGVATSGATAAPSASWTTDDPINTEILARLAALPVQVHNARPSTCGGRHVGTETGKTTQTGIAADGDVFIWSPVAGSATVHIYREGVCKTAWVLIGADNLLAPSGWSTHTVELPAGLVHGRSILDRSLGTDDANIRAVQVWTTPRLDPVATGSPRLLSALATEVDRSRQLQDALRTTWAHVPHVAGMDAEALASTTVEIDVNVRIPPNCEVVRVWLALTGRGSARVRMDALAWTDAVRYAAETETDIQDRATGELFGGLGGFEVAALASAGDVWADGVLTIELDATTASRCTAAIMLPVTTEVQAAVVT